MKVDGTYTNEEGHGLDPPLYIFFIIMTFVV